MHNVEFRRKQIGAILAVFVVLISVFFFLYVRSTEQIILSRAVITESGVCTHPEGKICPFQEISKLAKIKYPGYGILAIMLGFSMYLMFLEPKKKRMRKVKEAAKELRGDEKKVFDLLLDEGGTLFQNELVEKMGLSKVKVTRVLDKLEGKGLVERRRRGMSNVVILK